jgi:Ca-activated chloride channel family protein
MDAPRGQSVPRAVQCAATLVLFGMLVTTAGCGSAETPAKRARDAQPNDFGSPQQMTSEAGGETYNRVVDNPVLAADRNPLSTFSIAVDTASYSNVRRYLLQENKLPPADAVRVHELVNYFPYTYPAPKGDHPVGFTVNLTDCPWQPEHYLVGIGMKGREYDPSDLPPRNFVFLIDTSGSMWEPNRLPLLKASLALLVEQLGARDRVGIVQYAGRAGLVLPPTPGSDKATILRALDSLYAGGSTNAGDGIQMAYRLAEKTFIEGGINRVILGTDGDFNVGITDREALIRLIEEKRKSGVYLTVLGFGMGNTKDATMENLAHHGNGHYAYIDSQTEARKVFVEQGLSLVTIAKDVKLQVEFNPAKVGSYRLIGYENKLLRAQDFNDDAKEAGDLGVGHTVTALYEIVPAGQPMPTPGVDPLKYQKTIKPANQAFADEWLNVKLRYKDPESDSSRLLVQPLKGPVMPFADSPEDHRFAVAVAEFGMLLRHSEYSGAANYRQVQTVASQSLGKDPNGHRAEFVQMVNIAARLDADR